MKYGIYIGILLLFSSCSKKDKNSFTINLPYYSSQIEIEGLKEYDTLVSWDWYNDNMADDRKCFRIQDSKLGIVMEKGMLPENAKQLNQLTIKTPIKPNRFGAVNISKWINTTIAMYSEENPIYKFPIVDSLSIDGRKFGVLSIERQYSDKKEIQVFYVANINSEEIVFEFKNNQPKFDSLYQKSLNMMKSIKVKPAANNVYN